MGAPDDMPPPVWRPPEEPADRAVSWSDGFWSLLVVSVVVGGVVAALAGGVIGVGVGASSAAGCSTNDGWCELGAAVAGLAVGVLAGVVGYVVAGVVVVYRRRPAGRRAANVAAHILAPLLAVGVLALLGALTELLTT